MSDEIASSVVEITVGANEVRIEGSESFVSDELERILDKVDFTDSNESTLSSRHGTGDDRSDKGSTDRGDTGDPRPMGSEPEKQRSFDEYSGYSLSEVAQRINVPEESLYNHFYLDLDDDDFSIHIHDPRNIPEQQAFLGYCTIKEILSNQTYHNNTDTKKRLIDGEKVNIDEWGRKFLHNMRKMGYIKDDPNTDKKRNKPFKITPKGRERLVDWLTEN